MGFLRFCDVFGLGFTWYWFIGLGWGFDLGYFGCCRFRLSYLYRVGWWFPYRRVLGLGVVGLLGEPIDENLGRLSGTKLATQNWLSGTKVGTENLLS